MKATIRNVTIGADPEVFFVEQRTNTPHSVEGLIGGTKINPKQMEGLPEGFMIQEDNVAAEFNIPPASTAEQFSKSIHLGLRYVHKIAKENKLKLQFVPDLDFPLEQLQTKHAQTLGCDPDLNIWTETENPRPNPPERMRTAAGHIHIGWTEPTWEQVVYVAKAFDLFVTVPSILITEPSRRRQLYGRAGACRPKAYGVECRALDNFWLPLKSHQNTIFSNVHLLVDYLNGDPVFPELVDDYSDMIQDCINEHRRDFAEFLVDKFDVPRFRAT